MKISKSKVETRGILCQVLVQMTENAGKQQDGDLFVNLT